MTGGLPGPGAGRQGRGEAAVAFSKFSQQVRTAFERVGQIRERAAADAPDSPLLDEALEELNVALEELQVTEEELRVQNEELVAARSAADEERRRYRDLF